MLNNKTALVTGSAKRTGKEIALFLAKNGADVIIHYNKSKKEANNVAKKIKSYGRKSIAIKADLTKQKEVENLFKTAIKKFKKIDILINNVGNFKVKDISKLSYKEWNYLIDTTLNTTFSCCKACLPYMRKRKSGNIINMADFDADTLNPNRRITPYKIGKTGVLILTKTLAQTEAKYSIKVNAISPGIMENSVSKPKIKNYKFVAYDDINQAIKSLLKSNKTGKNIKVGKGFKV